MTAGAVAQGTIVATMGFAAACVWLAGRTLVQAAAAVVLPARAAAALADDAQEPTVPVASQLPSGRPRVRKTGGRRRQPTEEHA
jgi:hypothetical protein